MRKRLTILATLVLAVLLVAVSLLPPTASPVSQAAEGLPAPVAPGRSLLDSIQRAALSGALGAAPDQLIAGQNPGVYYLDYGSTVLDPNTYPIKGALRFFGWSTLQGSPGSYNWGTLDGWINARYSTGLSTGVFISTYDGPLDGDIRATPDFVIQTANTMVVTPEYVNYYQYSQNGDFETSTAYHGHAYAWDRAGNANAVTAPGGSWAAMLGGTNNAADSLTHWVLHIPAMPPELTSGTKMELQFSTYVSTTDVTPNADHLYVELVDTAYPPNVLYQARDITNSSGATGVWVDSGAIDVSSWVGRDLKVRLRTTTNGANPTTFYVDNVQLRVRLIIPKYWSTTWQNLYSTFVQALGDHIRSNNKVDFVSIGTGLHGETQPCNSAYPYDHRPYLQAAGLDSSTWTATVNAITDMYVRAFSVGGTNLVKNLLLQYAPYYLSAYERRDFTNYAAGVGVGLSYNGLLPDWVISYTNEGYGSYDPMRKWYKTVPIAWETYTYMLCSPVFTYWSLFSALDKHADYLRIGDDLLTGSQGALNTPLFQWAKSYWGKNAQNTPSAWAVMREHRNPTPFCHAPGTPYYTYAGSYPSWPQLGNYNFYLYQDDRIAGGQTVPETNDQGADSRYAKNPASPYQAWPDAGLGNCPTTNGYASFYPPNYPCNKTPYNPDLPALEGSNAANYYDPHPWTGNGKEAWIVRRTDQASSNPYMWFELDPQFISGTDIYSVTITVKYFDIGTDTWSLKYDSTSGEKLAGTVTKTGTKQLKEKTFTISDGKFAKRLTGGADFYIDSRSAAGANDGNEWIHLVDVRKGGSQPEATPTPTATATPTITPTPTATATPTITPTPTPSTGIVRGTAFYDRDGDAILDPDDPGLAGAVMVLKQGVTEVYTATSGADGVFQFSAVAPGQYDLAEKTPPPGYLLAASVRFAIRANETLEINIDHQPAPTATPTPTPTSTPTNTPTPTPTDTPTSTPTPTDTPTPTPTDTPTPTPTPTSTPTSTPTATPTPYYRYVPLLLHQA